MGLSVEPLRSALTRLGSPQDQAPSVLIGGTNGKGSTAAMVESVARASGLRTGLFHSPAREAHEHVHLDGTPVEARLFAEHFLAADGAGDLSWFEAVTAAAFGIFAASDIDLAIVEVGLGGRRDCTNTIAMPEASAVVSVDLDHQDVLGGDLVTIAREKAGIFRRGRPAIVGVVAPEVARALREEAENIGADLRPAGRADRRWSSGALGLELSLEGEHQRHNAEVALAILEALDERSVLRPKENELRRGFASCRWPGRLEWIRERRPVLLDGAHNPAAIRVLVDYWRRRNDGPIDVLFGVFADKDVESMLQLLAPAVRRFFPTATDHPRAMPTSSLSDFWQRTTGTVAETPRPWDEALNMLSARDTDRPLLVTGSLDLVARVRGVLLNNPSLSATDRLNEHIFP